MKKIIESWKKVWTRKELLSTVFYGWGSLYFCLCLCFIFYVYNNAAVLILSCILMLIMVNLNGRNSSNRSSWVFANIAIVGICVVSCFLYFSALSALITFIIMSPVMLALHIMPIWLYIILSIVLLILFTRQIIKIKDGRTKAMFIMIVYFTIGSITYALLPTSYRDDYSMVKFNTLPVWHGDKKSLIKVPPLRSKDVMSAIYSGQNLKLSLINNWKILVHSKINNWNMLITSNYSSCHSFYITLQNKKINRTLRVKIYKQYGESRFSVASSCAFGGGASIYDIYLIKNRYLAIKTSAPGIIFFDTKARNAMPFRVLTVGNYLTNLYTNKSNDIFLRFTNYKPILKHEYQLVRKIIINGKQYTP